MSGIVDGEIALFVPIRIKCFGDRVGLVPVVSEGQGEVLQPTRSVQACRKQVEEDGDRVKELTGSDVPLRSPAARSRALGCAR